jgi:hypothetical protein
MCRMALRLLQTRNRDPTGAGDMQAGYIVSRRTHNTCLELIGVATRNQLGMSQPPLPATPCIPHAKPSCRSPPKTHARTHPLEHAAIEECCDTHPHPHPHPRVSRRPATHQPALAPANRLANERDLRRSCSTARSSCAHLPNASAGSPQLPRRSHARAPATARPRAQYAAPCVLAQ